MISSFKSDNTRNFLFLVLSFPFFFHCSLRNAQHIYQIDLISSLPMVQSDGTVLPSWVDTISMYYLPSHIVCRYNIINTFEDHEKILNNTITYSYFVFKRQSTSGYSFYFSISDSTLNKGSVDSFLKEKTFLEFPFFNSSQEFLTDVEKQSEHLSVQKYLFKEKKDSTYPDTCYYYFDDRLRNIEYSFTKYLDSLYSSKVTKVKYFYNRHRIRGLSNELPSREFMWEIKQKVLHDEQAIQKLVDSCKRMDNDL